MLRRSLFLSVTVLLFSPGPSRVFAENICDPGSFLTGDLRAKWCENDSDSPAPRKRSNRNREGARATREQAQTNHHRRAEPTPIKPKPASVARNPSSDAPEPALQDAIKNLGVGCSMKQLVFSAENHMPIPAPGTHLVWGGNATDGQHVISPPYSSSFLSRVRQARANGIEVFAYLEGPCGDTDGRDDGERARCRRLHNSFNARFARGTPDTAQARWRPFTIAQMMESGKYGIGYCEIDNLNNNVNVPLVPLLRELKHHFDNGRIYCRIVLKNLSESDIQSIIRNVAPTPLDAAFIAPFHIYEAGDTGMKARLDAAMQRLKGSGSTTIISTDTNRYGSRFTKSPFLTCGK